MCVSLAMSGHFWEVRISVYTLKRLFRLGFMVRVKGRGLRNDGFGNESPHKGLNTVWVCVLGLE